jgi:hypothetical protein
MNGVFDLIDDFLSFWKEGRGKEEKHTRRPFVTATYLFATRATVQLVSLNRAPRHDTISLARGHSIRLCGCAISLYLFKLHARFPEQWRL